MPRVPLHEHAWTVKICSLRIFVVFSAKWLKKRRTRILAVRAVGGTARLSFDETLLISIVHVAEKMSSPASFHFLLSHASKVLVVNSVYIPGCCDT